MSIYNRDNFNEITNLSLDELDDNEIPDEELDDFKKRIDYFFSLCGGEDEDFKESLKLISLYLVFIAKKTTASPVVQFSNGKIVYKDQNMYYCTGKSEFIKNKLLLSKYCICSQIYPK